MSDQTPEVTEQTIRIVSLALWGGVLLLFGLGVAFLLEIIPSTSPMMIGGSLIIIAAVDILVIRFVVARMRRNMGL